MARRSTLPYRQRRRKETRARVRTLRTERRHAGLCLDCGAVPVTGELARCADCRAAAAARKRQQRAAARGDRDYNVMSKPRRSVQDTRHAGVQGVRKLGKPAAAKGPKGTTLPPAYVRALLERQDASRAMRAAFDRRGRES